MASVRRRPTSLFLVAGCLGATGRAGLTIQSSRRGFTTRLISGVSSHMRTSSSVGLLFGTLFFIVFFYTCWFVGLHFAWSYLPGLGMPLMAASLVAGVAALAFFLGIRRASSQHSPVAVVCFAVALFPILTLSNKWFLPGLWPPLVFMALAAFVFGLMGKTTSQQGSSS